VTYDQIKSSGFPFDWTSTQLEGFMTGIADKVGYDKPLKVVFKSSGAPRFIVTSNITSFIANMQMDMYLDDAPIQEDQRIITIELHGFQVDFKINVDSCR
jgi:hypothetical protein